MFQNLIFSNGMLILLQVCVWKFMHTHLFMHTHTFTSILVFDPSLENFYFFKSNFLL